MAGRRDDSSVVDLFDSIELDCSKWTEDERAAFRAEVGVPPSQAVGAMVANIMAAQVEAVRSGEQHDLDSGGELDVALDPRMVRALQWITLRRRQPRLAFAEVDAVDRVRFVAAIEKQLVAFLSPVLYRCDPETLALCLSLMLASACGRESVD